MTSWPLAFLAIAAAATSCRAVTGLDDFEFRDAAGSGGASASGSGTANGGGGASSNGSGGSGSVGPATGSGGAGSGGGAASSGSSSGGAGGGQSSISEFGPAIYSVGFSTLQSYVYELDIGLSDNGIVVGGSFGDTLTFPGGSMLSATTYGVFMGAYALDNAPTFQTSYAFSWSGYAHATALATHGSSAALLGFFSAKFSLGATTLTNVTGTSDDLVVAQLKDGGLLSLTRFENTTMANAVLDAEAIAMAPDKNVYIAGRLQGTLRHPPTATTIASDPAKGVDAFIAKLAPGGGLLWMKTFGSPSDDEVLGIAANADRVFLTGVFSISPLKADNVLIDTNGGADGFVLALDALTGDAVWGLSVGGAGVDYTRGAAALSGGGIAVTGSFTGSFMAGNKVLMSQGGADAFVIKVNAAGALEWGERLGADGFDAGDDVAEAPDGSLFVTGKSQTLAQTYSHMMFGKISANGSPICTSHFGDDDGFQEGRAVTVDAAGAAYVIGSFNGSVDFGAPSGKLTSAGANTFLTKFSAAACP